ncbi:MAG: hypothetical protein H5T76_14485 [Streptomyces sp.]|nr:hypothetical protein [Streptomyces sp.]
MSRELGSYPLPPWGPPLTEDDPRLERAQEDEKPKAPRKSAASKKHEE